jgi:hypothetical protein
MEFRFNYSIYADCPLKAGDLNDLYICINNQKGFMDPDRVEVDPIIMVMKNLKPVSDINWSILKDEEIIAKGMTNSGGASKIPILKKDNYLLRVFI